MKFPRNIHPGINPGIKWIVVPVVLLCMALGSGCAARRPQTPLSNVPNELDQLRPKVHLDRAKARRLPGPPALLRADGTSDQRGNRGAGALLPHL